MVEIAQIIQEISDFLEKTSEVEAGIFEMRVLGSQTP